ncbi:hypothetical protein QA942_40600 [Streptomyces sp. B21-106]|uniref:hypothetical protein n=1 Tax=Streptomyces sp. B21-106 TaxID=3039418 RepID=UPI002FF06967
MNGASAAEHLAERLTEVVAIASNPGWRWRRRCGRSWSGARPVVDVRRTGGTPADPDRELHLVVLLLPPLLDGGGRTWA